MAFTTFAGIMFLALGVLCLGWPRAVLRGRAAGSGYVTIVRVLGVMWMIGGLFLLAAYIPGFAAR
jgi:hypothetical protein